MLKNFDAFQLASTLYHKSQSVRAPAYIKDQLNRAALSVVLNLAEGSAKPTTKERTRFYSIAFASAREVQALLQITGRQDLWPLADRVGACLYRLVHPKKLPESLNQKPLA